jgi:pantothenate kinase
MTNKLAWLAGLWDGEGSITIFKTKIGKRIKYCPSLNIVNNDIVIMNEVEKIILNLGASMHWVTREHNNIKHATSYTLITRNHHQIKKIVSAIEPYLIGKKAQAEIILRFIEKRQKQLEIKPTHIGPDNELDEMCEKILGLNRKGPKSPTTICKGTLYKI